MGLCVAGKATDRVEPPYPTGKVRGQIGATLRRRLFVLMLGIREDEKPEFSNGVATDLYPLLNVSVWRGNVPPGFVILDEADVP